MYRRPFLSKKRRTIWEKPGLSNFFLGEGASVHWLSSGTLRCHDGDDNENVKKAIGEKAKQQLCTCITLFCTFLCRHCTTTTGKCLISRFMEDVNRRQLKFLSLSKLEIRLKKSSLAFDKINEFE